ncbi:MAG TPA: hypothetical protein VGE07_19915 [Herpetosiphonaceae bacterium]
MEQPKTCLWCGYEGPMQVGEAVRVVNPQIDLPHQIKRCPQCKELMLDVRWPDRTVRRKGREYPRRFRKSLWVVIYPVTCPWCGGANTEAYDINATIANPVSERFKYDIYRCLDCQRPVAISYLGEIRVHRADQDKKYPDLWYLDLSAGSDEELGIA